MEITENFGDLEDRAGLDLLHVLAIAPVPCLAFHGDLTAFEDFEDLVDLVGTDEFTQTNSPSVLGGDHDLHAVVQDLQNIEGLLAGRNLSGFDARDLGHAVRRVHCQIANAESGLHLGALLLILVKRPQYPRRGYSTLPFG